MPLRYVEYLDRPVRIGKDQRQKDKLREAAGKRLDKCKKCKNFNSQEWKRAMLIWRLNQPLVTYEQALEQTRRVAAVRKNDLNSFQNQVK